MPCGGAARRPSWTTVGSRSAAGECSGRRSSCKIVHGSRVEDRTSLLGSQRSLGGISSTRGFWQGERPCGLALLEREVDLRTELTEETMASVSDLHAKYGVEDLVAVESGIGGMTFVKLTAATTPAKACIYLFGAHVTEWCDNTGRSRLFTSECAVFTGKKAIRGGIPICFPQFGKLGDLAQHGFARTSTWEIESTGTDAAGDGFAVLVLTASEATKSLWPHDFELRMKVTLVASEGGQLLCELSVTNPGDTLRFTAALHCYFTVSSTAKASVIGLKGCQYKDQLQNGQIFAEESDGLMFDAEVDRVYVSTPDVLTLSMGSGSAFPDLTIQKTRFPEAVTWNPHVERSAAMVDLENNAWKHFICVEPAVTESPVVLERGMTWSGSMLLK